MAFVLQSSLFHIHVAEYLNRLHRLSAILRSTQNMKVRPYTKSAYQHNPLTNEGLSEIHVDLIGPLPESDGNRYVLMCVDRFTRWFTATPLPRQDVQTVISAWFPPDGVANYGSP